MTKAELDVLAVYIPIFLMLIGGCIACHFMTNNVIAKANQRKLDKEEQRKRELEKKMELPPL